MEAQKFARGMKLVGWMLRGEVRKEPTESVYSLTTTSWHCAPDWEPMVFRALQLPFKRLRNDDPGAYSPGANGVCWLQCLPPIAARSVLSRPTLTPIGSTNVARVLVTIEARPEAPEVLAVARRALSSLVGARTRRRRWASDRRAEPRAQTGGGGERGLQPCRLASATLPCGRRR